VGGLRRVAFSFPRVSIVERELELVEQIEGQHLGARLWGVTDEEAATLVDLPVRTFRRWTTGDLGRIDRDGKARLSNLLGVHKALRIIFREPQRSYAWIKAPNKAFGNRSALDVMLGGELTDLMRVRRYVDTERGAW
jgi:uncharacterized protein (DUF2384 family)